MSLLQNDRISIAAILLSLAGSYLAYPALPARIPVHWGIDGRIDREMAKQIGVFLYPGAMALVYIFFRLIPYADRNRIRQLREIGLYDPLRNGALLFFGYSHLLVLGIGLGIFSREANLLSGALSLFTLLSGSHIRSVQPERAYALLARLNVAPAPAALRFLCNGMALSGGLGMVGACTGKAQLLWWLLPLLLTLLLARSRFPADGDAAP